MLKTYRTELRRSPLLTAFPVMIAVDLVVLFGRSQYWIGVWPEASVAAQIVTLFLGPMLAGVSAWQAGRASRAGMSELLLGAARPGWRIETARLAATLTLGFLAYGIGCLTAAAVSWRDAGPGFLWPSYLVLGATTLLMFASVGHLAGRWWPSAGFTPVICALGGFVAMLASPFKFNVLAGPPDVHLRPVPVAVRLLLAAALVVLAVTAPSLPSRKGTLARPLPRHTHGIFVGSATCSLVALAAFPAAGELRVERPASAVDPLCDRAVETAPRVCVWPEHRKYLPDLTEMAQRLGNQRLGNQWGKAPDTYFEYGLRRTRLGDRGFDIAEGHVRTAAIAMAHHTFTTSIGRCIPPRTERRAWQAVDNIHMLLEYQAMGQDPAVADKGLNLVGVSGAQRAAAETARTSPAEQRAWLAQEREHLQEEKWCEPDARD
ncbi:ABC transporter permease [Streptomyces formicae]|uniref:ABC transporter permease n=1 Tax=Streptomyces formicae TaxID=1616117 RepID=A0ABY3WMY6_9ACTN|nr:ABC transporter permease [Streptomyces formicae]UNM11945.1 ABC transporter permease [Streptomyces formicae]